MLLVKWFEGDFKVDSIFVGCGLFYEFGSFVGFPEQFIIILFRDILKRLIKAMDIVHRLPHIVLLLLQIQMLLQRLLC